MIKSFLFFALAGLLSPNGAAGMIQGGGSRTRRNEVGTRDLYVEFEDNLYVHSQLRSVENEPAWVTYPQLRTSDFEKYLMYVVVYAVRKSICTFEGESPAPVHGEVGNLAEHIPRRMALTAIVPGDLDNFVTDDIEPYREYGQLPKLKLPPAEKGGHFGYAFIAIKGTKQVYVAKLYLRSNFKPKSPGNSGSSSSSSPKPYSPTHHIFNW